jgi:ATP-dependent RNA helicase DeaD
LAKFSDSITANLSSPQVALFRGLVVDFAAEHDVPLADIAAALAVMSQDDQEFLMRPEAPKAKQSKEKPADRDAARERPRKSDSAVPMATYRIRVGRRHKVQPGAIVGAIANEGGLTRADFGHIDIRIDHTLVELPAKLSAKTLKALANTRISGQLIELTRQDEPRKPSRPPRV